MTTTMIIPLHNPTLNIPSIASQELKENVMNARTVNNRLFFILIMFTGTMQKPYLACIFYVRRRNIIEIIDVYKLLRKVTRIVLTVLVSVIVRQNHGQYLEFLNCPGIIVNQKTLFGEQGF